MILDCVLTSVNTNPLYIDFIPIFVKTWNKLYPKVDVKIILIADEIPEQFLEYKNNIISDSLNYEKPEEVLEDEYIVEKILDKKRMNGVIKYKVKWEYYIR